MQTAQEIFDFVVGQLRAQGQPSLDDTGEACMYRGTDGRKCAAGHLIPDDVFQSSWEGRPATSPAITALVPVLGRYEDLVLDLQRAHDSAAKMFTFDPYENSTAWLYSIMENTNELPWLDRFELAAAAVAKRHGLVYQETSTSAPE